MPKKTTAQKKKAKQKAFDDALAFLSSQSHLPPGKQVPVRHVAKNHGIEDQYTTLWRRWKGYTAPRSQAHQSQQLLSNIQERILVEWITEYSLRGEPLSKRMLRRTVEQITGGRVRPGKNWIARFLKRHR